MDLPKRRSRQCEVPLYFSNFPTHPALRNIAPRVPRISRAQRMRYCYTFANGRNNSSSALSPRPRHALAYRVILPRPARDRSGNSHLSPTVLLGRDRQRKYSPLIHDPDSILSVQRSHRVWLRASRPEWLEPLSPFPICLDCGWNRFTLPGLRILRRAFPTEFASRSFRPLAQAAWNFHCPAPSFRATECERSLVV